MLEKIAGEGPATGGGALQLAAVGEWRPTAELHLLIRGQGAIDAVLN